MLKAILEAKGQRRRGEEEQTVEHGDRSSKTIDGGRF